MGLERISAMRKASGLTLDELSARSGVPVSTLKKISAGITKKPSIETIKSIVHAMGFTLDDLDSEAPDWLENKKSPPTSLELRGGVNENPVANLLKQGRKSAGLKADEVVQILAEKYGVSLSAKTLYGYEVGRSQPEIDCFFYLCDIYHVSPNILKKAPETDVSESEAEIQKRAEILTEALENCGYISKSGDLTDDQLRVLMGLVDFLDTYFG